MYEDKTDEKMSPIKKHSSTARSTVCFTFKFTIYFSGFRRDLKKKLDMLDSNKRFFMWYFDLPGRFGFQDSQNISYLKSLYISK